MADFRIYTGYHDVSTWSLRAWLPLKKTGVAFEETLIRYREPEEKKKLTQISPTGKVPLLVHKRGGAEIKIWDSLAIGEYLAELFPEKQLWPADPVARACRPFDRLGDALGLQGTPRGAAHGSFAHPAGRGLGCRRRARGHGAGRPHLVRLPRHLRQEAWRPVALRPFHHRRRHVCTGSDALPHLRRPPRLAVHELCRDAFSPTPTSSNGKRCRVRDGPTDQR